MTETEQLIRMMNALVDGDTSCSLKGTPFMGIGKDYQLAFHGSVDAANVIWKKLLPKWWTTISIDIDGTHVRMGLEECDFDVYADSHIESRARLLAIIKAKYMEIAKENISMSTIL